MHTRAEDNATVYPGADEKTPSLAQYFSWINNTNEGATEAQTLANLAFFEWLHDEFGMRLDIYAFDAGAIDGAASTAPRSRRGSSASFPRGFGPLVAAAARFGCRLGMWGGPDGFGDTEEDAQASASSMMVGLCRDHPSRSSSSTRSAAHLRPEKVKYFVEMMTECRSTRRT